MQHIPSDLGLIPTRRAIQRLKDGIGLEGDLPPEILQRRTHDNSLTQNALSQWAVEKFSSKKNARPLRGRAKAAHRARSGRSEVTGPSCGLLHFVVNGPALIVGGLVSACAAQDRPVDILPQILAADLSAGNALDVRAALNWNGTAPPPVVHNLSAVAQQPAQLCGPADDFDGFFDAHASRLNGAFSFVNGAFLFARKIA